MPEHPLTRDTADSALESPADEFVAVVVNYADEPDECTIYPLGLDDERLLTHWLSAEEGSFVALEAMC